MDAAKKKRIEAKLTKLFEQAEQADQAEKDAASAETISGGTRVIRRRKGKPDLHIPLEDE